MAGSLVTLVLLSVVASVVVVPAAAATDEKVIGSPELTVYSPNTEFSTSEQATLRLYVSNDGEIVNGGPSQFVERVTTARATRLRVESGSAPVEVDTDTYPVGAVSTSTSGPVPVDLTVPEDAEPGTYRLPVELEYTYTRVVRYTAGPSGYTNVEYDDRTVSETRYVTVRIDDEANFRVVDVSSTAQVAETGTLELTMKNTGTEPARDATVALESQNSGLTFGKSDSATRYVGRWEPGETQTITYQTTVSPDAKTEQYAFVASVDYEDTDGIRRSSENRSIGVVPTAEQSFSLSHDDDTLRVGREGELTGSVTNNGPVAASDAVLVLEPPSRNVNLEETEYALGDLERGESANFSFTAEVSDNSDAGTRQFSYHLRYQNAENETRESDPLNAQVRVRERRPRFAVETKNGTVAPGSESLVTVTVTNNADEPVKNLNAKGFADDPLDLVDDEAFVRELGPGESTNLTFKVGAGTDALEKTYAFEVDFKYEKPNGETKLSETYSVPVDVAKSKQGGGLPLSIVGGAGVVLALGAAAVWYRRD